MDISQLFRGIQGLFLDLDGTLIDSNDAHARAWLRAMGEHGVIAPFNEIRRRIGKGSDHLLPEIAGVSADSLRGKQIDLRRAEIFHQEYLHTLEPFPRARELLMRLHGLGFELIIATSASAEDLEALLRQADLEGLADFSVTSSDIENSKPEPDIILAALQKSALKPNEVLMIGDTPYDIEAATRAGVGAIGFTCGGWSREALDDAIAVFESPRDLLRSLPPIPRILPKVFESRF